MSTDLDHQIMFWVCFFFFQNRIYLRAGIRAVVVAIIDDRLSSKLIIINISFCEIHGQAR